jgi:hypothetical protein
VTTFLGSILSLDCPGTAGGDVNALLDWIGSPTTSSDLSARVSPFSDFWKATTTHTAAWQCSGPPLVAAGQHQSYPAAAQQNSKPQVVPDAPWNFPADPAPAGPSQPVNLVVGAQQDWLCPAGEHAAPPSLLFSPGAPLPFPSPVVTAAPARLVYPPQAAQTAPPSQATGAAPGPYLTMLQGTHSPPAAVPVWSPSMQYSHSSHSTVGTSAAPFAATGQQQWLPPTWTQAPAAAAAPFEVSTGMYAGMCAPPYPISCAPAPFGAFAAGCAPSCGVPGCHYMHAPAPGMGYGPPPGPFCTCMQCQYPAPLAQPWQDQSSRCSSGLPTPMQFASVSSSSLRPGAAPFAGPFAGNAGSTAGAGAGSIAAVLAAAAPGEQPLMRTSTLGRSGSGSCLTAAGAVHNPPAAPPALAPNSTAGPKGAKPSTLQAPSGQPRANAKGSAQGAVKGSAQMKPPAPRLVKPSTKGPARAGRARCDRQVDERLHALAWMEGGSKVSLLWNDVRMYQGGLSPIQANCAEVAAQILPKLGLLPACCHIDAD